MPHIIVKLYPGRSEQKKMKLASEIAKNVVEIAECKETAVSVAFEEIEPDDWAENVYKPDIMNGKGTLYKKPGYNPFSVKENEEDKASALMEHVREAARIAEKEDTSGIFNSMSWLDLELEDNPGSFDNCFDTAWDELSENEKGKRITAIRSVL